MLKVLQKRRLQAVFPLVDTCKWRWGVNSIADLLEVSRRFVLDPGMISCPTLIVVGEHLRAGGHSLGTNVSLMSRFVFDWLDEVLGQSEEVFVFVNRKLSHPDGRILSHPGVRFKPVLLASEGSP